MIRRRTPRVPFSRPRRTAHVVRFTLESLESRALLSTIASATTIVPALASIIADRGWNRPGSQPSVGLTNPTPDSTATTPAEILAAYGFSASSTAGAGTTIAIVDAYNDPNIQADLATFDAYYGLAAASLTVVNQNGQTTNLPATNADWSLEIAMDVEWAHAAAPGANIVLVEASSTSATDLMTAVQTGAKMANVVSMSWGGSEWSGQTAYDSAAYLANPNVTFVAASGDDGGANGAEWPASSPYVLSVGGTSLSLNSSGGYGGESAWSASGSYWTGYSGSTGGVSRVESLPAYQSTALGSNYASGRVVPDVAMNADPSTGLSVFSSVAGLSQSGWFKVGGTSAGAPIWSGLVANADQARAAAGHPALSTTQTLDLLYGLYGTSSSEATTYSAAFHDVTSGANFAGYATTGYDKVTGLGSPVASAIVSSAVSYGTTTTPTGPTTHPVTRVVHYPVVRRHDQTESTTTGSTDSTTSGTEADATEVAVLSAATAAAPTDATASALAATSSVDFTHSGALPNQAVSTAFEFDGSVAPADPTTVIACNTAKEARDAMTDPEVVPGRGDFPTPPILDPTNSIAIWDEALAGLDHGAGKGKESGSDHAEPQPFVPWTAYDVAEPDLTEAAPSLFGAAGLVIAFWMSWNRRESREDDRRFRPFVFPSPSEN